MLDPTPLLPDMAHRPPITGLLDPLLDPLTFKLPIAAHCLELARESDLIG